MSIFNPRKKMRVKRKTIKCFECDKEFETNTTAKRCGECRIGITRQKKNLRNYPTWTVVFKVDTYDPSTGCVDTDYVFKILQAYDATNAKQEVWTLYPDIPKDAVIYKVELLHNVQKKV